MDMLPPLPPPAIVTSVDQPERDLLLRLGDTQAWLHTQQDDLPDPYVSADDRERFLQDIDAFWSKTLPDALMHGQAGPTRRQAFAARLMQAARDSASLHAGHGLLPPPALDLIRRATEPGAPLPPAVRASELIIGDESQAGTLVLQDDTQPGMVLLFGTRTGWESFPSIDELLCEVEERWQIHLSHVDHDDAFDDVDTHFLRIRSIEDDVFGKVADRLIMAHRDSLIRVWDDEAFYADWEDRLYQAIQLWALLDLHRLGAYASHSSAWDSSTPTWATPSSSRPRRSPPVKPPTGTGRVLNTARRVGDHLGSVAGATTRVANDIAQQWGVGIPGSQAPPPLTSTLPRPQQIFSRRYSAPEVTLPAGPAPAGNIYQIGGSHYVTRGELPYRVQYDPISNAWRLSSRNPTPGINTGPVIDLGPNGQWEVRFPAPQEHTRPFIEPQASIPPIHHDTGTASRATSLPDSPHPSLPIASVPPSPPGVSASPLPIDLPPTTLSALPAILKDIIREELAGQLDNRLVDALGLFRRVRKWNDGHHATLELTSEEINAWNGAMASMRERLRDVRSPSPSSPSTADQLTDGDLEVATPEYLMPVRPGTTENPEGTLMDLLTTRGDSSVPRDITPETLDTWSETINQFVAHPRLTTTPVAGPSNSAPAMLQATSEAIRGTPLPAYPFDRLGRETQAQLIEEMSLSMPSTSDAEALFRRMEAAFHSGEAAPRLTRIQENAWRGAMSHLRLPRGTSYRTRRMEVAEIPNEDLEAIRNRLIYLKQPEAYDPLVYLRDREKKLNVLTDAQKEFWQQLLEHIRKRQGPALDNIPPGKRGASLPHGKIQNEFNDLSTADLRVMERLLVTKLDKKAQREIFRQKINGMEPTAPLNQAEETAWVEVLTRIRSKPSRFDSDIPSDAVRDFSPADMRELWLQLKARIGFRIGEKLYRRLALKGPTVASAPSTEMEMPIPWQQAIAAVRQSRRAPPPPTISADEAARGLWYVPEEEWPTTLYYYAPAATLMEATDHVVRLPITRLDPVSIEGIALFTSPPQTPITSLPSLHSRLLPRQAMHIATNNAMPEGSIGARSGAWAQLNPSEVRESLEGFVEIYRVGGPTSTSFILRPTARSTEAGFTDLWLNRPFIIHLPQP